MKSRQEFYHNPDTLVSQWLRPAKVFTKREVFVIQPAEVRPAPTKPKGIDRLDPGEFSNLSKFLAIASGELRRNQIERAAWQRAPEWANIRRETGVSDEELDSVLTQGDRLDVSLEAWLFRWFRGRTDEEEARLFQQFEQEVGFLY